MNSNQLNKLLISNFPFLQEKYEDETSWQEGDNTGSHIVYSDVFVPYIVSCIENSEKGKLEEIFNFIEKLLHFNDEYAENVVTVSILENLLCFKNSINILLGEKSRKIFNSF